MPTKLFSTIPIIQHSLATPLSNILLNSELAVENIDKNNIYSPKAELDKVILNAQHMKSLLSLQEKNQSYIFSPQKAISELIKLNQNSKLKKSLVTRVSLPLKKYLQGNKLLFQEVLVCLINNAYESYQKHSRHKMVFVSITKKNKNCLINVVDGGCGMNWWEKNLSSMPFHSQKRKHSGLGLFFVKQTIEKEFKGKMTIKTKKNKGTTIDLLIPFYKG